MEIILQMIYVNLCDTCPPGKFEETACTPTSNTICTDCTTIDNRSDSSDVTIICTTALDSSFDITGDINPCANDYVKVDATSSNPAETCRLKTCQEWNSEESNDCGDQIIKDDPENINGNSSTICCRLKTCQDWDNTNGCNVGHEIDPDKLNDEIFSDECCREITCPEGQEFVFSDDNQSGECDWVLCTDWYTNHADDNPCSSYHFHSGIREKFRKRRIKETWHRYFDRK